MLDKLYRRPWVGLLGLAVGRITGTVRIDELLDVIFRDFCIGK